jgi:hypothetical protein
MTQVPSHLRLYRADDRTAQVAQIAQLGPLQPSPVQHDDDAHRSGPGPLFWLLVFVMMAFYFWFLVGIATACPCMGDPGPCRCTDCPFAACCLAPTQRCALLPWRNQIEQRLKQPQPPPAPPPNQTDPAVIAALNHLADAQNKTLDALVKMHAPYQQIPLGTPPLQQIPLGALPGQVINLGGQPHVLIPLGSAPKQSIPLGPPPTTAPDGSRPSPSPTPAPVPGPGPAIPLGPAPAMPKVTEEPTGSHRYAGVKRTYALYR